MRNSLLGLGLILITSLLASLGCGGKSDPPQKARSFFNAKCATCHGPQGTGDGLLASSLNPKPRNHSDPDWQASITDDEIKTVILEGGRARGLSPLMPASPELEDNPELLNELVKLIRSFSK